MSEEGSERPDDDVASSRGEFFVYQSEDGSTRVECRFEDDTIWLSQALIAELYQTSKQNISLHLRNLLEEGELDRSAVIKDYLTTGPDGKRYRVKHYSLDAILAVGYRVRSQRGTQFRRWATDRLREYLIKGFAMDDERLKNPPGPGVPDYFDELLERIRDIRASERRMYLRVREIFALAADYEPSAKETQRFFQHVQNKLHYAATGQTAPELIHRRADHASPNMGLTSWKGGEVRSADVTVAKNYLNADEINELNRIVTMWLDFAEDQARRRRQVFINDWQEKLDQFLEFNDRDVLSGHGSVRKSVADQKARDEYAQFDERRRSLKEAKGEEDTMRALEDLARKGAQLSGGDAEESQK
ncbi:virulence RhuM family protein [Spiribacter vilamensis]|uniref:Virulence RhuM family protein n=1 Tax=Spiribacter vilamensis TaxID=531306 RepID=A0A4Q8D079_9GAMM|nr:virulence RhuM family protein [Spiribacter vilamensis]RZU98721.1 hypothetical protein EV698_0982 [Spiribacter vilamensis]TVO62255.1 virulence RhuM family protein [Spiribacter vilamensis]